MQEFEHIRKTSESASTTPSQRIWDNVSRRLDNDNSDLSINKRRLYKWLNLAAACVAILAVSTVVYVESNKSTEQPKGHIAGWEELQLNIDSFYDTQKLHGLHEAYAALHKSDNPI